MGNKSATCAGCLQKFDYNLLVNYRKKKWCSSSQCKDVIDNKVKHFNYKKKIKKIERGTYRNGVSLETRREILERDRYTCALCVEVDDGEFSKMQIHHITPVSEGGNDDKSNLITLCFNCHKDLHSSGWEEYVKVLQKSVKNMA